MQCFQNKFKERNSGGRTGGCAIGTFERPEKKESAMIKAQRNERFKEGHCISQLKIALFDPNLAQLTEAKPANYGHVIRNW